MIRELSFDRDGQTYHLEIDDTNDSESSDIVTVYGPDGEYISSYDTTCRSDAALIAEALRETY